MKLCEIIRADAQGVARAAQTLLDGRLVAFPTETVYGLGGDAESDAAITAIYTAKGRPSRNPLIVHVSDLAMAQRYGRFEEAATALARHFWPGPLTLVVPRTDFCAASPRVSAGGDTIALRVPNHPVALDLLRRFGRGIAAPSANRSGRISPTQAEHVAEEFATSPLRPSLILDGGATKIGVESTVMECRQGRVSLLRSGGLTQEAIHAVAATTAASPRMADALPSPGMLESHYAPRALVRLVATEVRAGEALLAFGATTLAAAAMRNLSPTGDLEEAAHYLYAYLRELDASGAPTIAVMPIPEEGVGVAINDRLRRAAAQRV